MDYTQDTEVYVNPWNRGYPFCHQLLWRSWDIVNYSSTVVCILLANYPASEVYMPTFRNIVHSIFIGRYLPAYEDGTECSETSAYKL